jgi:hypothetical protein
MPFAYYDRLTRAQKRIYSQSDGVGVMPLPAPPTLRPFVDHLAEALASGDRPATEGAADRLLAGLTAHLQVPPLRVEVLAARPARTWGELHGLYTPTQRGRPARVTVWMRTARHKRIVAFRTFLRTLLHELCHHLDYERLRLADSFHTEGFYKREAHLFHQLLGANPVEGPAPQRRLHEPQLL